MGLQPHRIPFPFSRNKERGEAARHRARRRSCTTSPPTKIFGSLKEDVPFREQLELDSMDFLDIVMELRKRYRIQIPEEEYPELASMGSTVRYLEPRMKDV